MFDWRTIKKIDAHIHILPDAVHEANPDSEDAWLCTDLCGYRKMMDTLGIEKAVIMPFNDPLLTLGIGSFLLWEQIGKWVLLVELVLWLVEQFFCHEYFTIFGSSSKKLKGYNASFDGTVKLFPVSETRLIPDLYHIVLHLLILTDLLLTAILLVVN